MSPLRAWNAFWFAPVSARPLGAFRVVVGLCTLGHVGLLALDSDFWLSDAGLLVGDDSRTIAGPLRPSLLHWLQDPTSVRMVLAAAAAAALALTLGWRTRIAGFVLYPLILSIHQRNLASNCGPDNLLLIMLFYLALSPCGAAYSLDARRATRRRGSPAEPLIVPWAVRLIQLHMCLIYLDTAVLKCNGATWLNGTAMHFVLHNVEFTRFDLTSVTEYPVLINLMSHGALLLEFCLAFLLWSKAARPWVALAGVALHAGVMVTINVPLFGELMTACYLTFLTPPELDALLRAVNPLRWSGPRPRVAVTAPDPGPATFPADARVDPAGTRQGPHAGVSIGIDLSDDRAFDSFARLEE